MNNFNIKLPDDVQFIIHTLQLHGFEAYAVGGCVRDSILGREPGDWDITTSASPQKVKEIFEHTVDTGIEHGTVTVLMNHEPYEVTTYRVDGKYEDHRRPNEVHFTKSLKEDLLRRDFTINAMAMDESGAITDLFGGRDDLTRHVIRCVGDPETRFREDALRMLRAYRFAAQLGFSLDEQTQAAIRRCAPLCATLSRERVREEAEKALLSDQPEYFGRMLAEGLLEACMQAETADFSGLSALPKTPEARWTAAKLCCPALDPALFRLPAKFCRLVNLTAQTWREDRTGAEWKRLIAEHGWETARLQASLQRTDAVRQIETRGDCVTLRQLAVTGADFPTLCGRDVGRMLHLLLVYALDHPEQNTKPQLLAAAPSLWQEENKIQG